MSLLKAALSWSAILIAMTVGVACKRAGSEVRDDRASTTQQPVEHQAPTSSGEQAEGLPVADTTPTNDAKRAGADPGDAERGHALVERFECNRCHSETGGSAVTRPKDCVGCHDDIVSGKFPAPADALSRWKKTSDPYTVTPSLLAVGKRLEREWLVGFLQQPVDLRPKLEASMPRLELSEQDARDLAAFLTRDAEPQGAPAAEGDVAKGRELVKEKSCGSCHAFTGANDFSATFTPGDERQKRAIRLAPDLRFTRERFVRSQVVQWLVDPLVIKRDSLMPNHGLSKTQAADVAAYLYETPLSAVEPPPVPARLPNLERRVTYAEVDEKVFRVTCRHCHSDPDASMGDGGPGNTGGFGFAPKKLDLATYKGIAAGFVDDAGERRSIFVPVTSGEPRLIETLLARQREVAGDHGGEVRGMPLGLPALTPEQVQLVSSWVAQGRPR